MSSKLIEDDEDIASEDDSDLESYLTMIEAANGMTTAVPPTKSPYASTVMQKDSNRTPTPQKVPSMSSSSGKYRVNCVQLILSVTANEAADLR